VSTWRLHAFDREPLRADFPFARSRIVVRSEQTVKKTGRTTTEARYYLSSVPAPDPTPPRWLALIRGHWGGVEIRNHWRRDAVLGEDGSRSRNAHLLANLALLRNVLLRVLTPELADQSLPALLERFHSHPARGLALLARA
jgi:predicted transposase YbfD/YdcC